MSIFAGGHSATPSPNPAGSVGYTYGIGKFEVSRDMITKFNASQSLQITLEDMTSFGGMEQTSLLQVFLGTKRPGSLIGSTPAVVALRRIISRPAALTITSLCGLGLKRLITTHSIRIAASEPPMSFRATTSGTRRLITTPTTAPFTNSLMAAT